MPVFAIEHSTTRYRADFIAYAVAVTALAAWLGLRTPPGLVWFLPALMLAGVASWSALEYALHRFVLHGVQPFARWHGEHHRRAKRPRACGHHCATAAFLAGPATAWRARR